MLRRFHGAVSIKNSKKNRVHFFLFLFLFAVLFDTMYEEVLSDKFRKHRQSRT